MTNRIDKNIKPLSEVPSEATILDPRGRKARTVTPKEGDLQCGIYLHGWRKTVFYDWDVEVEVLENPRMPSASFIYLV